MKIFCKLISVFIFLSLQTANSQVNSNSVELKKMFEGRNFTISERILTFKQSNSNYEVYLYKKNQLFNQYKESYKRLLRVQNKLRKTIQEKGLKTPEVTKENLNSIVEKKLSLIFEQVNKNPNAQQQTISFITKDLIQKGFPHDPKMSEDQIYGIFVEAIEHEAREELRDLQISQMEKILFWPKDPLLYLPEIAQEKNKIRNFIKANKFLSKNNFIYQVTDLGLTNKIKNTIIKAPSLEEIKNDSLLEKLFSEKIQDKLINSFSNYLNFIRTIKVNDKLEELHQDSENLEQKILSSLYLSIKSNENYFLDIIYINLKDIKKVSTIHHLNLWFMEFTKNIQINAPHFFQALDFTKNHLEQHLLESSYFQFYRAHFKQITEEEINSIATENVFRHDFNKKKIAFYQKY